MVKLIVHTEEGHKYEFKLKEGGYSDRTIFSGRYYDHGPECIEVALRDRGERRRYLRAGFGFFKWDVFRRKAYNICPVVAGAGAAGGVCPNNGRTIQIHPKL